MKRSILKTLVLAAVVTVTVFQLGSCKKDPVGNESHNCDIKGVYSGTSRTLEGVPSTLSYNFKENNFVIGSSTPTSPTVTYGGYKATCDSVILSVYYNANSSYYTLRGKLSNNKATISGTFQNTTTSESGTFTISK